MSVPTSCEADSVFFVMAAHICCRLRPLFISRLCLIESGIDAAEFVDVGIAQLGQHGRGGLTAISDSAVDKDCGILLGDYLGGGRFVNRWFPA